MATNPDTPTDVEVKVAVLSETGRRPENQDWLSWFRIPWGECYIVADGMGGYSGGAIAARMTVEGLEKCLNELPKEWDFEEALQEAVKRTNEQVYQQANSGDAATAKMGSTVAVALITRGRVHVGHIGDSRIYLFRRNRIKRLTKDHTIVRRMLETKMITAKEARDHPESHVLSRAIGSGPTVEIEIGEPIPLEKYDSILMCSDGLSSFVGDDQIEKVVRSEKDEQRIPQALVKLALDSGSDDNVTVQFVRYLGASAAARVTKNMPPFRAGSLSGWKLAGAGVGAVMLFWLMVAVLYYPGWDAIIRWAVGQKVGETESKSEEDNKKSVADVLPDDVGKDKVVIPSESGSDSETKLPKGSPVARPHEKATDNRKPVRTQKESRSVPGGVAQSQGGTGGTARTPATTQGSVVKMETGTVRIFTRSESEHDNLALMVEEELEKIKPQISPQEVDPFRLPPARHLVGLAPGDMFIYYSDPKLEAVTKIIAQALKNLPAFKGPGRSIDQQTGLYPDGRRALQDHVTGMVGAKHILIILPEE